MTHMNGSTKVFGIIGDPVEHSFSPMLYNFVSEYLGGLNMVYVPFCVKDITNISHSLRQLNIHGISVTMPHKTSVIDQIDILTPPADNIGSINTIKVDKTTNPNRLMGYNTDASGAVKAIKKSGLSLENQNVLIIGSGGSARAIAYGLLNENITTLGILSRNPDTMVLLASDLKKCSKDIELDLFLLSGQPHKLASIMEKKKLTFSNSSLTTPEQLQHFDLIIQTTPFGTSGHTLENHSILPEEYFNKEKTYFDIVYNPRYTPFLKMAQNKKANIILGEDMLLYQFNEQFNIFMPKIFDIEKAKPIQENFRLFLDKINKK